MVGISREKTWRAGERHEYKCRRRNMQDLFQVR